MEPRAFGCWCQRSEFLKKWLAAGCSRVALTVQGRWLWIRQKNIIKILTFNYISSYTKASMASVMFSEKNPINFADMDQKLAFVISLFLYPLFHKTTARSVLKPTTKIKEQVPLSDQTIQRADEVESKNFLELGT